MSAADSRTTWLSKPDGCQQCEPCQAPSLRDVVGDLEAKGIEVRRATEHHVAVCAACSVCPSGRVYAVRVGSEHVERLAPSGWTPMREPPATAPE